MRFRSRLPADHHAAFLLMPAPGIMCLSGARRWIGPPGVPLLMPGLHTPSHDSGSFRHGRRRHAAADSQADRTKPGVEGLPIAVGRLPLRVPGAFHPRSRAQGTDPPFRTEGSPGRSSSPPCSCSSRMRRQLHRTSSTRRLASAAADRSRSQQRRRFRTATGRPPLRVPGVFHSRLRELKELIPDGDGAHGLPATHLAGPAASRA